MRIVSWLLSFFMAMAATHPSQAVVSSARYLDLPRPYITPQRCSFNLMGSEDLSTQISARLTSGWSQEGVGVPEVRNFLSQNGITLRQVRVGVVDLDIDIPLVRDHLNSQTLPESTPSPGHGSKVAMVLSGPQFGMTQNAHLTFLYDHDSSPKAHYLESPERPVEIMTRSLTVSGSTSSEVLQLQKENQGQDFLLVNSAGNDYLNNTRTRGLMQSLFAGKPALLVSAVTPTGRIHPNSGGGPEVAVGAPSYGPGFQHPKSYHQHLDGGWEFSGTSAAAPMVTGALVGVLGLIEGLTFLEAKELLKQTSFATRDFKGGHSYGGYGVLNYYQLMRVAHRLQQNGWPENRGDIFEQGPGSIYDFSGEAAEKMNLAQSLLEARTAGSCEDKLAALQVLRQGFFLDPHHVGIRQALYALYVNEGYHDQALYFSPLGAEFYGGFLSFHQLEREFINSVASGDPHRASGALRSGGPAFLRSLASSQRDVLGKAFFMAMALPSDERAELLSVLFRAAPDVRGADLLSVLIWDYAKAYDPAALDLIKMLVLEAGDLNARDSQGQDVLYWTVRIGHFELVDFLLQQGVEVAPEALIAASEAPFLQSDSNLFIRRVAILRALARRGDVNAKNEYGVTALFTAVFKNNYLAADILLQMGAEVEVRTLISAILQDRPRLLKLLLVEGLQVDVNAVDSLGFSALAYAVNARNIPIIEILLAHGAEADARVWRLAARQGWEEVQSVLLRHFPPK